MSNTNIKAKAISFSITFVFLVACLCAMAGTSYASSGQNQIQASTGQLHVGAKKVISCKNAKKYIGKKVTVKGLVTDKFRAAESNGKPTFIDLGYDYPSKKRVTVIIWNNNLKGKLKKKVNRIENGDVLHVTGVVSKYKGIAQIEVKKASQIKVK